MTFHVGQIVVCIDDSGMGECAPARPILQWPIRGLIYTIRGFATYEDRGRCGVYLEEVVNPVYQWAYGKHEECFNAARFRPVETTSIEIFRKALEPVHD